MISIDLFELLHDRGSGRYGLSDVSQHEHALQSAALAQERNLGDELVIAALFHDVGHLLVGGDMNLAGKGVDDMHEATGADALAGVFGPNVSEPVRLHVAAKRYLCGAKADYHDRLSDDSKASLALQGGPMSPEEMAQFDRLEFRGAALALRVIDDQAKISGKPTPQLDAYLAMAKLLEQ